MSSKKNTDLVLTYENIDITNKDLDCLNPSTFVNDNIINFYLKYMYRCMLNNDQRQKVHIFDSFFCAALDEIDQGRVVRWLRRVDIFEKDYLVIPAIIDEHWFLIIIQNPGAILTSYNTTGANSTSNGNNNGVNGTSSHRNRRKQPAIIIMDSMPDHTKDKKPQMIQYLYNFIRIACSIKGKTIFVHQLRQFMPSREYGVQLQSNDYDCGLLLLENAERFFVDTFKIAYEADSETEFRLSPARRKRDALRKFIAKLAEAMEIEQSVMNRTIA